jgi:uncharacterized protein (DUF934 family)
MAKLLQLAPHGANIIQDDWITLSPLEAKQNQAKQDGAKQDEAKQDDAKKLVLLPLATWLEVRATTSTSSTSPTSTTSQHLGVWLDSHEDAATIADDVNRLSLIAINFPTFKDGRGYSIAYLLRKRYGYRGRLRAIGEVLRDQLFYLSRVGFDEFLLADDANIDEAIAALGDFSETYQGSVDQPLPLYQRRAAFLGGRA